MVLKVTLFLSTAKGEARLLFIDTQTCCKCAGLDFTETSRLV